MVKFQLMKTYKKSNSLKYSWLQTLLAVLLFLPVYSLASPIPAMGSSSLMSPNKGYMFHLHGFELNRAQTSWTLDGDSESSDHGQRREIAVRFQSPQSKAFLSVKTETLIGQTNPDLNMKKWIRDYSSYGFDVLGAKEFTQNNAHGYVVDLFHAQQKKQLRQVIFLREKTAVILTCTDSKETFQSSLSSCNSILKTFSWM